MQATARVADPEERQQLWPLVNRTNRGMSRIFHRGVQGRYDVYQRHVTRTIPWWSITPDRSDGSDRPDPPDRTEVGERKPPTPTES